MIFAALCIFFAGCAHEEIKGLRENSFPERTAPEGVTVMSSCVRVTFYMNIDEIPQKDGEYQWQVVIEKTRERFSQWLSSDWPDKETVVLFRKYMKDNGLSVNDLKCSYIWSVNHMTATIRLCLDEPADAQIVSGDPSPFDLEL
jgi:hypothetical protein